MANTGVVLFEIDVDGDWFDVVQWVFLIERQTNFTFLVEFGNHYVFSDWLWIILPRTYLDVWVCGLLLSWQLEPIRL
jgi:hypothetical protein